MFGSPQDNVIFEVYSLEYDTIKRRQYVAVDPDLANIHGHIQDVTQILQKFQEGNTEIDKNNRFKLFITATPSIDSKVKEGLFIRIKQYKDKYTKAWQSYSKSLEFTISKINPTDYLGRGYVLTLTDKQSV
jgi:hypothetical protein